MYIRKFKVEVRKYCEKTDYDSLISLFKSEKDWDWFLSSEIMEKHKKSLGESITYIIFYKNEIIGYIRAIEDIGSYIYVCELLVNSKYRGKGSGKILLDRLITDYPEHHTLVMSDVDQYYQKLGYKREGSIFKVS